jgi:hypothetical protein
VPSGEGRYVWTSFYLAFWIAFAIGVGAVYQALVA